MKFRIYTLGCKVNTYESEGIASRLCQRGALRAAEGENPDTIIVNTCSVTGKAGSKSRQLIRKLKKDFPESRMVITGCHTALNRDQLEQMEETDLVLEYADKYRIAEILTETEQTPLPHSFPFQVSELDERTRGFLMIQDGCDSFCSYCIIPHIRGNPQSRPLPEILDEAREQAGKGIPEIVLTGIHTGSYGRDLKEDISFVDVILSILEIPGEFRIRLSSIEINEITPSLIELFSSEDRLCPHFPIPLQSGSDRILKLMNRKYTTADYRQTVDALRNAIPDCALTTDVICGFPGETDSDFNQTLKFSEQIGFSRIHAFSYSIREGTPAAQMKDQIPGDIKKKRTEELAFLGNTLAQRFANRFIGKRVIAVAEAYSESNTTFSGYTEHYIPVQFKGPKELKGNLCSLIGQSCEAGVLTAVRET